MPDTETGSAWRPCPMLSSAAIEMVGLAIPPALERARHAVASRYLWARDGSRRFLARFDPNDDPDAEPLDVVQLVALAAALGFSLWMFWRWKFQPMQDLGHHVGLTA